MKKGRRDEWTPEDDAILTETVLKEVARGKSQVMAFRKAGNLIDRTGGACGFRWNNALRKHFESEIKEAIQKGRLLRGAVRSIPVYEPTGEAKEQLLQWEKALAERETRLREEEQNALIPTVTVEPEPTPIVPSHYHKGGIDILGFLESHFGADKGYTVIESFCIGNIFKYVARYKQKNGQEDLEKALYYLQKLKQQGE